MDIEQLAVAEIKKVISRTDYIKSFINDGDKEPCWDGNLYVYSDISQKNEYYKGKVPIQIKGKKCKKFSDKELKYLIRVVDLQNYSIEGGTIYFVVEITENYSNSSPIMMKANIAAIDGSTKFEVGSVEVNSNVTIKYNLAQ
ncbi:MAG: hypothetical protein IJ937_09500 [Treponema sp.]|nr:hypothetical protein [Treponema sp.]